MRNYLHKTFENVINSKDALALVYLAHVHMYVRRVTEGIYFHFHFTMQKSVVGSPCKVRQMNARE